jgi:alpha-ketoglutarate-dependent 2,4-dichlorophenoxyacetate dioxygenase
MALTAMPLHDGFVAGIAGIDLARRLADEDVAALRRALDTYAVCIWRGAAPLSNERHIALSRQLGPVQAGRILNVAGERFRLPEPEMIDVSNLDADGTILADGERETMFRRGNQQWHTDVSFAPIRATYSLLAAHELPPDGGPPTEFADMRAAWDALSGAMKSRLEGLTAEHSVWHSRLLAGYPEPTASELASRQPARHLLVHVHPGSHRKALYLASHASHIVGMDLAEGRALLAELTRHATQPRFVHRHHWRVGDLVIWDNLATMHRAMPFADTVHRRDMRRTTCREREAA